ncbi:universal stress protein [Streptomyces sp. CRN 30]|uniref:universal stress protein n=1 Tax=Streptomyces sp. CRN 30 TaxID=3075613 RepID=UPI002A80F8AF|nr:universal stress protein [Streptomyces sp. CRN 30]
MEQVVLREPDAAVRHGAAADWAAAEARLRGLPLRYAPGEPSERRTAPEGRGGTLTVVGTGSARDQDGAAGTEFALRVVSASAGPVVVVPCRSRPAPADGEVTLGVDARAPAGAAVAFAFNTARSRRARLRAVHAWSLPREAAVLPFAVPEEDRGGWEDQEVQLLADALRPWRERYPEVRAVPDVVLFTPVEALTRRCGTSALLVVGRPSGKPVGRVARALVRAARCPVAVVPSPAPR